jgi:anti-sigma factor ChrR (cupin superfamily)
MSRQQQFGAEQIRDLAALHAVGLVEGEDAACFEQLLADRDPVALEEMAAFHDVAGHLALSTSLVMPPERVEARIMEKIRPKGFVQEVPGIHVLRAGSGPWVKTPFPGVACKRLFFDPATNLQTTLLQLEPGALYPAHEHKTEEQCWVLSGDVRFGNEVRLTAGDFTYADSGTRHKTITSDGGCLLLIVSNRDDEFV